MGEKKIVVVVSGRAFNLYRSRMPLMQLLIERGYEVHAIAADHDGYGNKIIDAGVMFHPLKIVRAKASLNDGIVILKLRKILMSVKPHIVHYFNTKPVLLSGFVQSRSKSRWATVCSLTGVGFDGRGMGMSFIRSLFRYSISRADMLFLENESDKKLLEEFQFEFPNCVLIQIASGVDTKQAQKYVKTTSPVLRFAFLGRLVRKKGIYELLEAFRVVKSIAGTRCELHIVGELDENQPDSISEIVLKEYISDGSVHYRGMVSPDDIWQFLTEIDVVILPSYREGYSKTLMEAAATGTALAASDVPGCREIVKHRETGLLFESKSSASIVECIKSYLNNTNQVSTYSENARKMAIEEFDSHVLADKTIRYYDWVLHQ